MKTSTRYLPDDMGVVYLMNEVLEDARGCPSDCTAADWMIENRRFLVRTMLHRRMNPLGSRIMDEGFSRQEVREVNRVLVGVLLRLRSRGLVLVADRHEAALSGWSSFSKQVLGW